MSKDSSRRLSELNQETENLFELPDFAASLPEGEPVLSGRPRLVMLHPEQITAHSPLQTRATFDPDHDPEDEEFAQSIKTHGVIQPVLVYELDLDGDRDMKFGLISGHRRLDAALYAHLDLIPALLVPAASDTRHRDLFTILENLQRKDLLPVEKASQIKRLMDRYRLSQIEVATFISLSKAHVSRLLSLLDAAPEVKAAVDNGKLSIAKAIKIEKLAETDRQQLHDLIQDQIGLDEVLDEGPSVFRRRDENASPMEIQMEKSSQASAVDLMEAGVENSASDPHPPDGTEAQSLLPEFTGPIQHFLAGETLAFQQAFLSNSLSNLVPDQHLHLLAVIWLYHSRDIGATFAVYQGLTKFMRSELEKALASIYRLSIFFSRFNYPGAGASVAPILRLAVQLLLEK